MYQFYITAIQLGPLTLLDIHSGLFLLYPACLRIFSYSCMYRGTPILVHNIASCLSHRSWYLCLTAVYIVL